MNGPTRLRREGDRGRAGDGPGTSADVFDELDQFVDSEPASWSRPPTSRIATRPPAEPDGLPRLRSLPRVQEAADEELPQGDGPVQEPSSPAFSRSAASRRREAFAKRLNDELSRPARPAPASPPAPEPAPEPEPAPAMRQAEPLPAQEPQIVEAEVVEEASPPRATPAAAVVVAKASLADEEEDDPVVPPVGDPDEPADALDWELDNAIGEIIANNSKGASGEPEGAEPAETAPPAPVEPAGPAVAGDAGEAEQEAPLHARPVGSPKRLKPIPSFQFERRSESDADAPAVIADVDDPLSTVLFQDVREKFAQAHPDKVAYLDDGSEFVGEDGDGDLDDEYAFGEEAGADLPPALKQSREARSRRGAMSIAIVGGVAGVAVLALAAVVGVNVFAGSEGTEDTPPIIRADARDVKVRADPIEATAEADITERTRVGEAEELVVPERVDVASARATPTQSDASEEPLVSRRVRTVVVRPDGTIVSAGDPSTTTSGASSATEEADLAEPEIAYATRGGEGESGTAPGDGLNAARDILADPGGAAQEVSPLASLSEEDPAEAVGEDLDAGAPSLGGAVVPRPRPTPPVRTARRETAAPVSAAPSVSAAPASPWGVQVASQRSRADAEATYNAMRARYPSILGGTTARITEADIAGRGRFYRVRIAANSQGEAAALCQRLKAAGADCFVGRN